MASRAPLFTVGHSNLAIETFLDLLRGAGVEAVADVRSQPYSRLSHFRRGPLEQTLRQDGIAYVFLGALLGGRPADARLYDDDRGTRVVCYERVRGTTAFAEGLERLERGRERFAIALLCGEEDPLSCHRGLMITPALVEQGVNPVHLRAGGRHETMRELEARVLEGAGVSAGVLHGLFPPTTEEYQEMLREAYRTLNRRWGYRVTQEERA